MRIAVCDDDSSVRSTLIAMLDSYCTDHFGKASYEVFSCAEDLLQRIKIKNFDVLILDVIMPEISGLDAAKEIRKNNQKAEIIFLSSSPEFAVNSYDVRAFYYLLKPISPDKLVSLLDELFNRLFKPVDMLYLKSAQSIVSVPFQEIEFVEVVNRKLYFHLENGRRHEISAPLNEHEDQLLSQNGFIKVHRAFVVNLHHIRELTSNEFISVSGKHIPISRNHYRHVREAYIRHLFDDEAEEG